MNQLNLIPVVIAGITTGGLTCFAVQGGLLTAIIAQSNAVREKLEGQTLNNNILPTLAFIISKILVYTVLGFLLGLFGSFFKITATTQAAIQIAVSIYMMGIALQLLNIHPFFRYFIIQPPKSMERLIRKVAKGNDRLATPALFGLLTVIIPCGTTLAMEALAVSSGSPLSGAVILLTFTLSSSWVFFAYGFIASKFNNHSNQYFYKITAFVLILLALISFNGGLNLLGSRYSLETLLSFAGPPKEVLSAKTGTPQIPADFEPSTQKVTITVTSSGYSPDTIKLKKGVPVILTLKTQNSYSCANAFTIPKLNVQKVLPVTGSETITFTPTSSGFLAYSCSMGMYRGNFIVE